MSQSHPYVGQPQFNEVFTSSSNTGSVLDFPISVVVPTRGRAALLEEALNSVRVHLPEIPSANVFVVDDGPDSDTRDVVQRAGATYILGGGLGPSAARNLGLDQVRTSFVGFLDDDDVYQADSLRAQLANLAGGVPAGFAFTYAELTNPMLQPVGIGIPTSRAAGLLTADYFFLNDVQVASVLFRTEAIRAVGGFHEGLRYCEDSHVYARVAARFGAMQIAGAPSLFRQRPSDEADGEMRWRSFQDRRNGIRLLRSEGIRPSAGTRLASIRRQRGHTAGHLCRAAAIALNCHQRGIAVRYLKFAVRVSLPHCLLQRRTFWGTLVRLGMRVS